MHLAEENSFGLPCIVTNKHVIQGASAISIAFHLSYMNRPSGKFHNCLLHLSEDLIFRHDDDNVDLCAILVSELFSKAALAGRVLFFDPLPISLIPEDEDWEFFDAIENVTMIGCPRGLMDEVNNLPIIRRGITASPMSRKFNGEQEFMVDMACFPGSSGSPIFLYDLNGFLDRRNNTYKIGQTRIALVGILYSGPQISNEGQIILGGLPTLQVSTMMHLGNAIRASRIRDIDQIIRKHRRR